MANPDSEWKPNARPQSTLALNFSAALDDLFRLNELDALTESVEQKKDQVQTQKNKLQDLDQQLREADEKLRRLESKHRRQSSQMNPGSSKRSAQREQCIQERDEYTSGDSDAHGWSSP